MSPTAQVRTLSDTTVQGFRRHDSALADVEQMLASGSPPAAVASGLRHILLRQLDLDFDHGPAGTALLLAWLLKHRAGRLPPRSPRSPAGR